jgi:RND superfamily putative drug exporter
VRSLARWCSVHRRVVLGAWIGLVVGLTAISGAIGSDYKDSFKLSGTDSFDALHLLQRSAPKASGDTDQIVVAVDRGRVTDPATRARVTAMLARVAKLPHVVSVVSPYDPAGARQVARGGRVAYADVTFDGDAAQVPIAAGKKVIDVAQAAGGNGLQVELGGQVVQQASQQGPAGTVPGFLAAAVVLLIVFGSLLAAALPLLVAIFALMAGVATISLLSHAMQMASFSQELSLLIGLGVGIDYALFIVTRFRQALMRGHSPEDSVVQALDTAGRAVFFAGITVCIALLGMFALGVSFLYGAATASSIVVAFTVAAALTLLPALLGFFGPKLLTRAQRRQLAEGRLATTDESPAWARWARLLRRRPGLFTALAVLVMLAIATPFLSLRLGSSDAGSDPASSTTRKAYDLLARGFGPGFSGPFQLVAELRGPRQEAAFRRVVAAAGRAEGVAEGSAPVILPATAGSGGATVGLARIVPASSPQAKATTDLLHRLRDEVIPAAAGNDAPRVLVGGPTAIFNDFAKVLAGKLPLFVGVVVLLSFLLLMAVFRSIVIPLMAAVMNLLSVAAAFGVVVAIFQLGWGAELIGVSRTGPIEAFLPVMVFAILFGLSMDYEVFLVSRIYEEWHKRGDNSEAVSHGLAATGRTITAAATIMVLVFGAFVLGDNRIIKLFGIGLAGAVFLDALIVRSIIIPGLMLIVGRANWALPARVERVLPRLNVEGAVEERAGG